MRILHLLLMALCLLPAGRAAAQDIFVLEDERIVNPLEEDKKAFASIQEYARSFYSDCRQIKSKAFSADSQDLFCACMAANISEVLTLDDVSDISKNNEKGEIQRDLIKKFLYVPCTIQPVYGIILNQCLDDKELQETLNDHVGSCKCVAVEMTDYWREHGLGIASSPREQIHSKTEPLIRFLLSAAYGRKMEYVAMVCAYPEGMRFNRREALDRPRARR